MRIVLILSLLLTLSACGADVATSAATAAKLKAQEVKQAQETKAHLTKQINAAMAAGQQRLHDADQEIQ